MNDLLTPDAEAAVSTARCTGSVGCTYNRTQVQRLYTSTGGIGATHTATDWWVITDPDGTSYVVQV